MALNGRGQWIHSKNIVYAPCTQNIYSFSIDPVYVLRWVYSINDFESDQCLIYFSSRLPLGLMNVSALAKVESSEVETDRNIRYVGNMPTTAQTFTDPSNQN